MGAANLDWSAFICFRDLRFAHFHCQHGIVPIEKDQMWQLFKEFLLFLKQEKRWWLAPLVVVLLILGALIVFSSGSVLAPFMYPFM
jgi:hypothetical protein